MKNGMSIVVMEKIQDKNIHFDNIHHYYHPT